MDGLAELDYKGCPENYMKIRPKELLGLNINPVSVLLHFKMWKPWKDYEQGEESPSTCSLDRSLLVVQDELELKITVLLRDCRESNHVTKGYEKNHSKRREK